MIRRQLRRRTPPGTASLYGRAVRIDGSVRELSLRQFNAKYVLRVKRELSRRDAGADRQAAPSTAAPIGTSERVRSSVRTMLLQFAREVLMADRTEVIRVIDDIGTYVDRIMELLDE